MPPVKIRKVFLVLVGIFIVLYLVNGFYKYNGNLSPARVNDDDNVAFAWRVSLVEGHFKERLDRLVRDIQTVLPKEYDKSFRNPCWTLNDNDPLQKYLKRSFVCVPSFFLAGFPKCGTTQLYRFLTIHPEFAIPEHKEPHFWKFKKDKIKHPFHNGMSPPGVYSYLRYFVDAANSIKDHPNMITCDCSASTIWYEPNESESLDAIPYVLSKVFPHSKYIVIMRNPVEQSYSRFWYGCRYENISSDMLQKGPEIFETIIMYMTSAFTKCISTKHARIEDCANFDYLKKRFISMSKEDELLIKSRQCGSWKYLIPTTIYSIHLEAWLNYIPREKMLFLTTDELAADPVITAEKMYKFLGLQTIERKELSEQIKHLGRANTQTFTHQDNLAMTSRARERLIQFYRPYNKRLAELLDERFLWNV